MQTLPSAPVEFLTAPAPSAQKATSAPSGGEESFSRHLANETGREPAGIKTESTDRNSTSPDPGKDSGPETTSSPDETNPASMQNAASAMVQADTTKVQVPSRSSKGSLLGNQLDPTVITAHVSSTPARDSLSSAQAGDEQLLRAQLKNILEPAGNQGKQNAPAESDTAKLLAESNPQAPATSRPTLSVDSLERIITAQPAATVPSLTGNTEGQQKLQAGSSATVTVEQWSATYKANPEQFQPPQNQTSPPPAVPGIKEGESVLQTENGQTITFYKSSDQEELAMSSPVAARAPIVDHSGQRQDSNSNYIHSNLPNNSVKATLGTEGDQNAGTSSEQQDNTANMQAAKELAADPKLAKETTPITPFTLDNTASVTSTQQSTATTTPGADLLKLPSGSLIQESTIMDQVINRLSINRKLESGSIRLQLHPQELGELRLEIEVKQDNVKAHITAQNPQAQEALDRHLPRLRETLEQQGLTLGEVEITVSAGDQYEGHRFQQNEARHQLSQSFRTGKTQPAPNLPTEDDILPAPDLEQGLSVTV